MIKILEVLQNLKDAADAGHIIPVDMLQLWLVRNAMPCTKCGAEAYVAQLHESKAIVRVHKRGCYA